MNRKESSKRVMFTVGENAYGLLMRENPALKVDTDEIPERLMYGSVEARMLLGGMPEPTFRRLTGLGRIRTKKVGGRIYVEADELRRFIDESPSGANPDPGSVTFLNGGKSKDQEEDVVTSIGRGFCPYCRRWFAIRLDGTIYAHAVAEGGARCPGSRIKPEEAQRGSAA